MIISCRLICVFALLINKASLQHTVDGVIGGSVVLPCNSSALTTQDINVRWRHKDKLKVCDIIQGKFSAEHQDSKYKNRAETFPEEYKKGNFSLKLNNLTHTDAGKYQCYITHSGVTETVSLRINESMKAEESQTAPEEGNNAGETKPMRIFIHVLVVLVLFCLYCI